jgi:hypothetical protein
MSGGMLMEINQESFVVENIEDGDFHSKFTQKIRRMDFGGHFCLPMVWHKMNLKNNFYLS